VKPFLQSLLTSASANIQAEAMKMSQVFDLTPSSEVLALLVAKENAHENIRIAAIHAMADEQGRIADKNIIDTAINSNSPKLRVVGLQYLARAEASELGMILAFLKSGKLIEKQQAVRSLAKIKSSQEISKLVQKMLDGKLDPGIHLEVTEAAISLLPDDEKVKSLIAKRSNIMDPKSFEDCLEGGDPEMGENVFMKNISGQCVRCHKYEKRGPGSIIGPNLWKVGQRDPRYLLESIIAPQATITKNFGNISIDLKDGSNISGLFSGEGANGIKLYDSTSGSNRFINHGDISSRSQVVSIMPPMGALMERSEIRDLIAFLRTLDGQ